MKFAKRLVFRIYLRSCTQSKLIEFTSMFASSPAGIALPDWDLDVPLSGCTTASNGASYYLWKLVHRLERSRFARGKCYDLSALPTREHGQIREYVVRHGEVCNRLADHPRFPKHFTTTPDASGKTWWVIDEWTPGPTWKKCSSASLCTETSCPV